MWCSFFYGVLACAIWGLVYLIPLLLPGYDSSTIASGRFAVYGLVCCVLVWSDRPELVRYHWKDWWRALLLGVIGNIVYYWFLTECIQNAGALVAAICMGLIPVLTTVFGNLQEKRLGMELPWKPLSVSIAMIALGTVLANWSEFHYIVHVLKNTSRQFWFGTAMGTVSLFIWSWYALSNAEWLRLHPKHSPRAWSTAQGLTAFPFATAFFVSVWQTNPEAPFLGPNPLRFALLMLCAGFLCSWLTIVLWNRMCQQLPASVSGQVSIFETVFVVFYAYALRCEMPEIHLVLGLILLVGGVLYAMRTVERSVENPHH